ncbi:MAG: hypothetical protein CMO51_04300 [Verrucomicrobiales bacterium]|jgi:hypothetical protein|nr:hypothetical protein [Verrucomicrobiales bacterium]|tara:strand:+ start:454 stop:1707 length:1254 start_codon:yes stop_codon:yes gene_type:complete
MAKAQKTEGSFKIKNTKKAKEAEVKETPEQTGPAVINEETGNIKLDLTKKPEQDADTKQEATNVVDDKQAEPVQEVEKEIPQQPEPVQAEESVPEKPVEETVLEEITEEKKEEITQEVTQELKEDVAEAIAEQKESGIELPENIQKVVNFVNETGGSLEDYVKLNTDYDSLNENQLLAEYYQTSKPHLDRDEINFIMEDKFSYNEDEDDEKDIRKKKIARKEELANAKNYLDGLKSKYYAEIKGGSKLLPDQQKAVEFFNRYNKEQKEQSSIAKKQTDAFLNKTNQVFNDNFKGFEYNVGDKKYRFNVKDANKVKDSQSDINNFVKKFLNENNEMSDASGYHKSLFTAMNPDQVAKHFYEQGKADAIKDSTTKAKNVTMGARGVHSDVKTANGWNVRSVVSEGDSTKLKIKSFKHLK